MKVINLFAGPGAGKSTTASGLFYLMKKRGVNIELITEYAKVATWEGNDSKLEDQLYITAKQNRKLWMLKDQVDWVVTDSPLLLGAQYVTPDYFPKFYKHFLFEVWEHYDNINYVISRTKKYNPIGRNQTHEEAKQIDENIVNMLKYENVSYKVIVDDPQHIVEDLAAANLI